jgi:imidazolonepropionase-like amidohydrolase
MKKCLFKQQFFLKNMKLLPLLVVTLLFQSCKQDRHFDLAIENSKIFDAINGVVISNKTILIQADTIAEIIDKSEIFNAQKIINADGKLVIPGMIDTHIHLTDVFGDYEKAPLQISEDSSTYYRTKLTEIYLPFGVTAAMVMGQPEKWLKPTIAWMKNPSPSHTDIYTVGGALISDEERTPYLNHVEVMSPDDATKKVEEYHNLGIKHLKLYWRLREPEMKAIIKKSEELNMKTYAHIDNNIVTIDNALDWGVNHFEHFFSITNSVFLNEKYNDALTDTVSKRFNHMAYTVYELEKIQFVQDNAELRKQRDKLIEKMIKQKATLSSCLQLFGSICKRTYFTSLLPSHYRNENPELNEEQITRLNQDFDTFMAYVKAAHDKGLKLRIGTDCIDGGKAILSEQLLLYESGFSISSILQICTINGATALQMDNKYGSIGKGKKANLVIYEQDPFDNYKNFLSKKTVIKDGVEYSLK